jgi:hypothetical protein
MPSAEAAVYSNTLAADDRSGTTRIRLKPASMARRRIPDGPGRVWCRRNISCGVHCRDLIAVCRGKGLFVATVPGILRALSTVLTQAVEDELLVANQALRMGKYLRQGDEPRREIQPLTREEVAHLSAVAKAHYPRWHPLLLCAVRTGLRQGELLALRWADLDFANRFVASTATWCEAPSRPRRITSGAVSICRGNSPKSWRPRASVSANAPSRQGIQVTVDIYGHLVPGGNRAAVDRLDDAQPDATPAQPDAGIVDPQNTLSLF